MFKTPAKSREGREGLRSSTNSTARKTTYPASAGPQASAAIQSTASSIRLANKKNIGNSPIIPSLGLGASAGGGASIPLVQSQHYNISRLAAHPAALPQSQPSIYTDMDYASGFVAVCFPSLVSIWNARRSLLPPTNLPMPLYNMSYESPCIACLAASASPSSSLGVVAINRAGLVRAWGNVELPKMFCEAELPFDDSLSPLFLTRIQVRPSI